MDILKKCTTCEVILTEENWPKYCRRETSSSGWNRFICKKCTLNEKNKSTKDIRIKVLKHYGPNCKCCGESNIRCLTVDHINGGGRKHNRSIGNIYSWAHKNKFPEGLQTLCFNCNCGKNKFSCCPHNKEYEAELSKTFENKSSSNSTRKCMLRLKKEIVSAYGGKCEKCGESNIYFLTIDHKNDDGNIERKETKRNSIYNILKKLNYPKENYRLLCFNCNCSKNIRKGWE